MADDRLDALRSSIDRLNGLATALDDRGLATGAYPSEWTIADVLSHLGSGAVITHRRLDDALAGHDTPEDFAPGVWDEWNAKTPSAQRDDALTADADLLARLDELTEEERARFRSTMGPMTLDLDQFVGMRLNEHALHTWDIEVVADPSAILPSAVAAPVVDNLDLIARFTAAPTGDVATITIATTDPERRFAVDLSADSIAFAPSTTDAAPDVVLPAEALARLVYGRLDADHTPPGIQGPDISTLRQVFPGP